MLPPSPMRNGARTALKVRSPLLPSVRPSWPLGPSETNMSSSALAPFRQLAWFLRLSSSRQRRATHSRYRQGSRRPETRDGARVLVLAGAARDRPRRRATDLSQRDNWRENAKASCLFTFAYFRSRTRRRFPLPHDLSVIHSGTDEIF